MLALKDIISQVAVAAIGNSFSGKINLEAMEDDRIFVRKDGSLASVIALHGAYATPGKRELAEMSEYLRTKLQPYLARKGFALEVNFMRDKSSAANFLERNGEDTKRIARSLGLELDDVLEERVTKLKGWMVDETMLLTVCTRPTCLEKVERDEDSAQRTENLADFLPMGGAQVPGGGLPNLMLAHKSWVEAVLGSLNDHAVGQKASLLSVKKALQDIRAGLYPETAATKDQWSPLLPHWSDEGRGENGGNDVQHGKRALTPMAESQLELDGKSFGFLGTPTFDQQLASEDIFIEDARTVYIGRMGFSGFDVTVPPEVLTEFNALVADVTQKDSELPWRASFRIEGGGVQAMAMKTAFLSIFLWSSKTHNTRMYDAITTLRDIDGQDDCVVRLRMSFMTWDPDASRLRRASQMLQGAVRRWGNTQVDTNSGEPLATVMSCMPAVSMASTAPAAAAPLRDALAMLPLGRQASPWQSGGMMYRTESGKPWPFSPGSSLQTTWANFFVGTPGTGKSVQLNAAMLAMVLTQSKGEAELPLITAIDHGRSLTGVASLIREALPANRQHEVVCQELSNTDAYAINFMDTQLGMRKPLPAEKEAIRNMVKLLVSDDNSAVTGPMAGLINATIDHAYEQLQDHNNPKRYSRSEVPAVDEYLDATGYPVQATTAWWEVVDYLAINNQLSLAEQAQRRAVPVLTDLVQFSAEEQVAQSYNGIKGNSDRSVIEQFHTAISEITREYPMLKGHTRYSIGSARIIVFEMSSVAGKDLSPTGQKRTGLMYMLARQIGTRSYFLRKEDIEAIISDGSLPEIYHGYHLDRARRMRQTPKAIIMDEVHRCSQVHAVMMQAIQDVREGRKNLLQMMFASQMLEDFPADLLQMATGLVICNIGSSRSMDTLDQIVELKGSERWLLKHKLKGPGKAGASVFAVFKTKGGQDVRQHLMLTLGPIELWAYSTSAVDVGLRDRLYEKLGPVRARRILAHNYPSGSAESVIEKRIEAIRERGEVGDEVRKNVIADLAEEMVKQSFYLSQG